MGRNNLEGRRKFLALQSALKAAGFSLSEAGLTERRVGVEVLWFLPETFTAAYEALWLRAYGGEISGRNPEEERAKAEVMDRRVSTNQTVTLRGAKEQKKRGAGKAPLGDEKSRAQKARVDRKLRRIGRELAGEKVLPRRCTKCRQWAEPDWAFCPFDGSPTEDV